MKTILVTQSVFVLSFILLCLVDQSLVRFLAFQCLALAQFIGPINLLSDKLLRYVLIFEYQILVLDLVVDIRTKISEDI